MKVRLDSWKLSVISKTDSHLRVFSFVSERNEKTSQIRINSTLLREILVSSPERKTRHYLFKWRRYKLSKRDFTVFTERRNNNKSIKDIKTG